MRFFELNFDSTRNMVNDRDPGAEADAQPMLVPLLTGWKSGEFVLVSLAWLATLVFFWAWWLRPEHNIGTASYLYVSLLQAWLTFLPAYFLFIFFRARQPVGPVRLPPGCRVAMVVTKAPSEPFPVVAETLTAMLAQDYPHDTWLADEDPSLETIAWCARHNVQISTRKGRTDYHRKEWPRRTRCKEGNLAYFYDMYGYERYDFVAQLDADHVPKPGYLRQMMRPFADPAVGYVSAPSICDKNAGESWSARGRLHCEATMHGALQAGYNGGWAPHCIGSHYSVRTKALKEIGGLGPELAEDHSTTLMMNAHGWRGIHAMNAYASGDGPRTFADLITQEFQWSRSLVMILLKYTPQYLGRLPPHLKFQFVFSQLWYPLFAIFMASCFAMPVLALVLKTTFVDVTYPAFLLHSLPMGVVLTYLVLRMRAAGMLRPNDGKVFSWEMLVFLFAKWPWILAGTIAAIHDRLTGGYVDFRVTPKGRSEADPLPARVLAPYVFLSLASALPVLLVSDPRFASGFSIFALVNAAIYAAIYVIVLVMHGRENRVRKPSHAYKPAVATALVALLALPVLGAKENGLRGLDAVVHGARYFTLTARTYPVAGAGQGGIGVWTVTFAPRWIANEVEDQQLVPVQMANNE